MTTEAETSDRANTRTLLWHHAWLGGSAQFGTFTPDQNTAPRPRFDEIALALPTTSEAISHNRACIAHIAAHKIHGGKRFRPESLKPIQIALVSLLEDARVEQLALRERPGLRHLWLPYFRDTDLTATSLPNLLRRLTRALFDVGADDDLHTAEHHAWVLKGRRLFLQRADAWDNPAISREIGSLLGNDLGQMRIQFNWKNYVVEPAYRDDNSGLWQLPAAEDDPQIITLSAPAIGDSRATQARAGTIQARHTQSGEPIAGAAIEKTAVFALPEWDYALRRYRNDWVQAREFIGAAGDMRRLEQFLAQHAAAIKRAAMTLREVRAKRFIVRRHQHEGDDFDLDVCVENRIAQTRGDSLDPRVYRALRAQRSECAVSLLLDASQSTATIAADGRSFLQHALEATAWFGQALAVTGDSFAISAFQSAGRNDVRLLPIKRFHEQWDNKILARLAGIEPALSTRLGSALRYAQQQMELQFEASVQQHNPTTTHLLFVLSDGEPADIDCFDERYLREDACCAVRELTRAGTSVFCIALTPDARVPLTEICGRQRVLACSHIDKLGQQLQRLYAQLAQ